LKKISDRLVLKLSKQNQKTPINNAGDLAKYNQGNDILQHSLAVVKQ
jgi:hypothetical protein